jgi:hypothetical protein
VNSRFRILAAVLTMMTLVPAAFGHDNVICVESSGRVSYGCEDVVPDEMAASVEVGFQAGLFSEDCGPCHDFTVGQAIPQSAELSVVPTPVIESWHVVPIGSCIAPCGLLLPVSAIDSSGSLPPQKC